MYLFVYSKQKSVYIVLLHEINPLSRAMFFAQLSKIKFMNGEIEIELVQHDRLKPHIFLSLVGINRQASNNRPMEFGRHYQKLKSTLDIVYG